MLHRRVAHPPKLATLALLVACLSFVGCFPVPVEVPSSPATLDARGLEGEWFVVASNFPMWLDGEKTDPRFRYSGLQDKDGLVTMRDEVSYLPVGERVRETIDGVDTQDPSIPAHFTWRGDGALILFTSEWYVAHLADNGAYAIIYFTETPATPAGVDVITRADRPTAAIVAEAEALLRDDPFLRAQSAGLRWLRPAR